VNIGRVYVWRSENSGEFYGRLETALLPLQNLDVPGDMNCRLSGRYVQVRNAGAINECEPGSGATRSVALANAQPNGRGDFIFEPGRGGGRVDKVVFKRSGNSSVEFVESGVPYPEEEFRSRYVEASRFGEVNTYFHVDRIAAYVNDLLEHLGAAALPRVTAVVSAHDAATAPDGIRRAARWLPFQGGHYRMSRRSRNPVECNPISPDGEIHLGPGRQLTESGALNRLVGGRYRANASHNAGIVYHEYGHHITRHTADFRLNVLRQAEQQDNKKTAIDEGTCDYWAAVMLGTPHIWILHHRHDEQQIHPRSLESRKTMADYDSSKMADPHANGTIWGAALWDLRKILAMTKAGGAREADMLLLRALICLGRVTLDRRDASRKSVSRARSNYSTGLSCLLLADAEFTGGRNRALILATFTKRGIQPGADFIEGARNELLLRVGEHKS
jgi:hypothetical protein